MIKSPSKSISILLLLSYLTVSTGRPLQLVLMLSGLGSPVLTESKPQPFSANNGRSFKPTFKHFAPQVFHPYSPVDTPEKTNASPMRAERILKFFTYTDYFQSLLLYSDGMRGPPGIIFS